MCSWPSTLISYTDQTMDWPPVLKRSVFFFHSVEPVLRTTRTPDQWLQRKISPVHNGRSVKLTTNLNLMLRLIMRGDITQLPPPIYLHVAIINHMENNRAFCLTTVDTSKECEKTMITNDARTRRFLREGVKGITSGNDVRFV
jgi:hypothetical protein